MVTDNSTRMAVGHHSQNGIDLRHKRFGTMRWSRRTCPFKPVASKRRSAPSETTKRTVSSCLRQRYQEPWSVSSKAFNFTMKLMWSFSLSGLFLCYSGLRNADITISWWYGTEKERRNTKCSRLTRPCGRTRQDITPLHQRESSLQMSGCWILPVTHFNVLKPYSVLKPTRTMKIIFGGIEPFLFKKVGGCG